MLSFANNQKNSSLGFDKLGYEPLIIDNKDRQSVPLYQNNKKHIIKSFDQKNQKQLSKRVLSGNTKKGYEAYVAPILEQEYWKKSGKIGIFDGKLRKNQLAEEQRRLRAEQKRMKKQEMTNIVNNQVQIRSKTLNLEKEQQKQIQKLKRLIDKERQQKQKNDRIYDQKLKMIEKERNQLIKLQRKIQETGVRNTKQLKKQIKVLIKNEIPQKDQISHAKPSYPTRNQELTQSELISKTELRQRQLQALTNQREKALQNHHSLNYNPTIIPLLSKASYKIISTHISTLVQLFIDDLLQEQVDLLEEIQLKQRYYVQRDREREVLNDYYRELNDFVDETQEIEGRLGRYTALKFQDLYIPKNHYNDEPGLKYQKNMNKNKIQVSQMRLQPLKEQVIEEIETRRDRFVKYVGNFDEYKKNHMGMFERVTQEVIEEVLMRMAKEMESGSNDFVEMVFRKEFQ